MKFSEGVGSIRRQMKLKEVRIWGNTGYTQQPHTVSVKVYIICTDWKRLCNCSRQSLQCKLTAHLTINFQFILYHKAMYTCMSVMNVLWRHKHPDSILAHSYCELAGVLPFLYGSGEPLSPQQRPFHSSITASYSCSDYKPWKCQSWPLERLGNWDKNGLLSDREKGSPYWHLFPRPRASFRRPFKRGDCKWSM